ncbi:hypothetical protein K0M31_000814 [Melipona bicolor]|uniref:Uncharacterized protein n=1 Tax=Melipona bicolor TaxID=60889 RepID=A0AA40KX21_9HYME|nr:hypothetical protein K0M31_000814 [Melipona bicolor]
MLNIGEACWQRVLFVDSERDEQSVREERRLSARPRLLRSSSEDQRPDRAVVTREKMDAANRIDRLLVSMASSAKQRRNRRDDAIDANGYRECVDTRFLSETKSLARDVSISVLRLLCLT